MKKLLAFACVLACCGWSLSAAEPVKAVLVVQNHVTSGQLQRPLTDLEPLLSEALSQGGVLRIVNPHDVIGTTQNRLVKGELDPESSSVRLAENCGAWVLVTASVNGMSVRKIGNPVLVQQLVARVTLEAKCVPGGESVGGVTVSAMSSKKTVAAFESNLDGIYEDLMGDLCRQVSENFVPQIRDAIRPAGARPKVTVGFGCNVAGVNVEIDGIAHGTAGANGGAPLRVETTPGLHHLTFRYPFMIPYEVTAMFNDASTFNVTLAATEEGRLRCQNEAYFRTMLDRLAKSGAVDDEVRREVAKGTAACLSASYKRIQGMPQQLVTGPAPAVSNLLNIETPADSALMAVPPSTESLRKEAEDASRK